MALLPPRVKGPLSECSTRVRVEAVLTGADVEVYAGPALKGSATATGPVVVVSLSSGLAPGEEVRALQRVGMDTSAQSPDAVVVQAKPPTVGPVAFRSHLHICGRCVWLEGLIPGAKVEIEVAGSSRGTGESYDGNARVHLSSSTQAGETLVARQEACGEVGEDSPGHDPDWPGGPEQRELPKPTVETPLRACQRGVVVSDVFEGATVTLLRSGGPNQQACFDLSALRFVVNPGLAEGETVSADQQFPDCEIGSAPADPVVVDAAEPVPPPVVHGPLCAGATTVRLGNLLYGSKVRIFQDGVELGMAEAPEEGIYDFPVPPLAAPTHHGSVVTATQELCGIWSAPSDPVDVDPLPAAIDPPRVPGPLFACGTAVRVTNTRPGSRVYVLSAMLGAPIGELQVFADEVVVPVAPALIEGDEISAYQLGCGLESDRSEPVVVQPLERLPAPRIETPLYACDLPVVVLDTVPGARVEVYVNDAYRGSAIAGSDRTEVGVVGRLEVGDLVKARQRMCGKVSGFGEAVRAEQFQGRWITVGGEKQAEILAVHAALLHTGKIVFFGGDQHTSSLNASGDVDHTRLFDCATWKIDQITGLPASADLFCAGHCQLADGSLLVGGGTHKWRPGADEDPHGHGPASHFIGSRESWLFEATGPAIAAHGWRRVGELVTQRASDPDRDTSVDISRTGGKWYPTLVLLPDGRGLAVSGHPREFDTRHNNDTLERYNTGPETWDYVGAADSDVIPRAVGRTIEYPRLFVIPGGDLLSVSQLADGKLWRWHIGDDPNDWDEVTTPRSGYGGNPLNHTAVLLPLRPDEEYRARVLMAGESTAWVLDPDAASKWTATPRVLTGHPDAGDVNPRRANLDAVLLPTGEVFIGGGAKNGQQDATGVKKAEMFDPEDLSGSPVGTWRVLPEAQEVRNYHSVALLMPNGAVWVAGGNINSATGLENRNLWIEIFEPWYFCYWRPRIAQAPASVCLGNRFTITSPDASQITRVVLVRAGSVTHNFNPDQRLVECTFEHSPPNRLTVQAPPSADIAPLGYYLLFLVDGRRVPSGGAFIKLCTRRRIPPPWWLDRLDEIVRSDPRLLEWLRTLTRSVPPPGRPHPPPPLPTTPVKGPPPRRPRTRSNA